MIFLTDINKAYLDGFLETRNAGLLERGLQIQPIKLKEGWCLPESILTDPRLARLLGRLNDSGRMSEIVIRDIAEDEFIKFELNGKDQGTT